MSGSIVTHACTIYINIYREIREHFRVLKYICATCCNALFSPLQRLDGRDVYDYRELTITLGKDPGQVEVRLGGTRVLGHVTCQVIQPKPERPTDGQLFFNIELSPMASPAFEVGR